MKLLIINNQDDKNGTYSTEIHLYSTVQRKELEQAESNGKVFMLIRVTALSSHCLFRKKTESVLYNNKHGKQYSEFDISHPHIQLFFV